SLHGRAPWFYSAPRCRARAARHHRGHGARRQQPAEGLPFCSSVPLCRWALPRRIAAAARHLAHPSGGVLEGSGGDGGMSETPVLEVNGLVKHFPVARGVLRRKLIGVVRAVEDVSFEIKRGETLALVGESGCGKSTTGRSWLRRMNPTAGSIRFKGEEIAGLDKDAMRRMRRHLQIIFQDPYASLNPRMTVGDILSEPLNVHEIGDAASRAERVRELLAVVGLH